MGYAGGGINGALRWKDLALDRLLPVDEVKEEFIKAAQARKMTSGTAANHPPAPPQQQQPDLTIDEEEDDENDENDLDDDEDGEESYDDEE